MKLTPFHLAIQVRDIDEAREFYGTKLGFPEGRSSDCWVDFDMFGHQFVVHLNVAMGSSGKIPQINNAVDGHSVPVPHFGVVLEFEQWQNFAETLSKVIDDFIIEPYIRFAGEPGEQGTLFFLDPSGNALEFKGFKDIEAQLFT
ncbi:MAG: extradiol dioxygenase family protein [Enterobacterales bacterium]|jgi:extradiol dioxygenase family protein